MSVFRCVSIALLVVGLFTFADTTPAQTSVYGTAMEGAFGFTGDNYPNGPSMKPGTGGLIGGVFYTFASPGRFKTGLDARATFSPGYDGGSAYTGAVRFGFVPRRNRLRPYFEFGGGVASTQLHETVCSGSSCGQRSDQVSGGVVQVDFGLDVRVTSRLDVRALDYGADAGGSRGLTSADVGFVSAGAVYHFGMR